MVVSALLTAAGCSDKSKPTDEVTSKTQKAIAPPNHVGTPEVFRCEKSQRTCFLPSLGPRIRHYSDCVTDTLGKSSQGCFDRPVAYCYQAPHEWFCLPTMSECQDLVKGMREGTVIQLPDMKPQSDCVEMRPDEF